MTVELTLSGTPRREYRPRCKRTGDEKMVYTVDEGQLPRVWTAISCFERIREIQDPTIRSEILTNAQILLTAFALGLQPLPGDQVISAPPRTSLDQIVTSGA
jgi:hypothetical protein